MSIVLNIKTEKLIHDLLGMDRSLKIRALSRAITLIENNPNLTEEFLAQLPPCMSRSHMASAGETRDDIQLREPQVIGLTGLPGSGKSTLVNLLIKHFRAQNKTVAVLAVDPTSSLTGGAVLGDRIRMQEHFKDDGVFIRSMGTRGALGGLAQATHGAVELFKLLNFDVILIETVGIGQSESDIINVSDTVILVLLPNTGDEIQFMKAGVIQLAHIFVINKTDLSDPHRMIQELLDNEPHSNSWKVPVVCTSAIENRGLDELSVKIEAHQKFIRSKEVMN